MGKSANEAFGYSSDSSFKNLYDGELIAPFKRNKGKGEHVMSAANLESILQEANERYGYQVDQLKQLATAFDVELKKLSSAYWARLCMTKTPLRRNKVIIDYGMGVVRNSLRWDLYFPATDKTPARERSLVKPLSENIEYFNRLIKLFPVGGAEIIGEYELNRLELNHRVSVEVDKIITVQRQLETLARIQT